MEGQRRGGGRPFDYGELRLFVLGMIAEQPRHGYELIKAIEDRFAGAYSPSPGVVYPALSMLEEMGAIALDGAEGPRKRYAITAGGHRTVGGRARAGLMRCMARSRPGRRRPVGGRRPRSCAAWRT